MSDIIDVAIVGAGLSGLQAAISLQEQGLSVVILEARDRVGGKTCSIQRPDGKGIQELGAAWLNSSDQSTLWAYAQRFGLRPVVQNVEGSVACEDVDGTCHFFPFSGLPSFPKPDVDSIAALRDAVEAASLNRNNFRPPNRSRLDQLTFEQWCRQTGATTKALQTAAVWCRGTLGQEPSDISALAFLEVARGAGGLIRLRLDGPGGAQHLRLQDGTQAIAVGMAGLLNPATVRLNSPVTSIVGLAANQLCCVQTANGDRIDARKVILSVPGPAYKNITFDPPLPPQKQMYTAAIRYGCYVKYLCLFKTPFWREEGSCGLAQSFRGPMNHCRDTSIDSEGNYALTCFLSSKPGRQWLTLNEDDRRKAVVRQLGSLFAVGERRVERELIATITSEWMQDKWAGWGCPFAAPPTGTIGDGEDGDWFKETSGAVHFVGTELTNEWRGYMEGALRSGKRGADQVLHALRVEGSRI